MITHKATVKAKQLLKR